MLYINFVRVDRHLTVTSVCKKTKIYRPHLCEIFSGRRNPTPAEVELIAKALSIPTDRAMTHVADPFHTADSLSLLEQDQKEGRR